MKHIGYFSATAMELSLSGGPATAAPAPTPPEPPHSLGLSPRSLSLSGGPATAAPAPTPPEPPHSLGLSPRSLSLSGGPAAAAPAPTPPEPPHSLGLSPRSLSLSGGPATAAPAPTPPEDGSGVPFRLWARSASQLFDQNRVHAFVKEAMRSDALVVALHGGTASCPAWDALMVEMKGRKARGEAVPWLHVQSQGGDEEALMAAKAHSDGVETGQWAALWRLLSVGGPANMEKALHSLSALTSGEALDIPLPEPVPFEGIHHPDHGTFLDLQSYLPHLKPGRPTVGILMFQTHWLSRNTAHTDALIRELEARGANVLPVFSLRMKDQALGNRGADDVVDAFFKQDGKTCIDVLISTMSMSLTLTAKHFDWVLPALNVPVLQAMTSSAPHAQWTESPQGMSTMDVTFQAAQPEFDGNLITLPIATREEDRLDPLTGALLSRLAPIAERVESMADLTLRWAALRHKPNQDKKIAIIFHHHPPRNDRIGCAAGLDSFDSIRLLLDSMSQEGYAIDRRYACAEDLAREMLDTMTCDQRWLTPDEMARRAVAKAGPERYKAWHAALPGKNRQQMTEQWGRMPGELFTHEGMLQFAGVKNGNVFLSIQPPRGDIEKAVEHMHDLHLSPPHHYLAHYRYIRDVFQADAVIHVGTHGSLEWLPGKALGLSESCYPDLALLNLPNIYPYIINNPSEGTQAKRRSACALVDHMTPPFRNAELYEETAAVEQALTNVMESQRQDPSKVPLLLNLLWEVVEKADLHQELAITKEEALADSDFFIERLHERLTELADTQIADGLHSLGQPPVPERLVEYLAQLVRLPNGDIPSLRETIVARWGYTVDELIEKRGKCLAHFRGRSGGQILLCAHEVALELLKALAAKNFEPAAIPYVLEEILGEDCPEIATILRYVACDLLPRILAVDKEMQSVLGALSGRFVEPGPSGAPTRGQADILPSGRNFYSLDPRTIPSPGAWEVGVSLAKALLARYLKEEGRYPRNIGMIVWGGAAMRTKGDDLAEIFYLMGLRPLWQANGQVKGLEVIPVEELGRPRIDVTPRISGFFRDAFPNLVDLLDEAVRMVASLHEVPENNFIRAHVICDSALYQAQGLAEEEAWRQASLRVFGCPPGAYGAGVSEMVESKAWKTREDLGEAYIRFSAHAYGKNYYGQTRPEAFRQQLSRMDVTVKNEDCREWDMLSCTDFYNYHGGLIAAAATVRGEAPFSMVGDSSDPKRVATRSTEEESKHILRARLLNPTWIEGLKRHGYKGAGDLSKVLDILLGWDATANVMEDWMYQRVANRYALDPAMQEWFKKVNPYAMQNILDKLLEAVQRGMWAAENDTKEALESAYLDIEGDIEEALAEGVI